MPRKAPITLPHWEISHAAALQAMARGEASEGQQKQVLDWIIKEAALTYDMEFNIESQRLSDFAGGRRFVGLQIVKLLNLKISVFTEQKKTSSKSK